MPLPFSEQILEVSYIIMYAVSGTKVNTSLNTSFYFAPVTTGMSYKLVYKYMR